MSGTGRRPKFDSNFMFPSVDSHYTKISQKENWGMIIPLSYKKIRNVHRNSTSFKYSLPEIRKGDLLPSEDLNR
jgi:hypothetical protein